MSGWTVIVAGPRVVGRTNPDQFVKSALHEAPWSEITGILHGGSGDIDWAADRFARERGLRVWVFFADWERFGPSAGPRRNREMAEAGHALVAVWNGKSRGTADMISAAAAEGLPFFGVPLKRRGSG